ncbi:MAG TPA: selenocysteine-specific translation elongation factor [Desulfitobacteriaceae bacterium]|nr:selenocysteine-specific translation elongation factor [Desulfitobacteriaceae bacterium]
MAHRNYLVGTAGHIDHGKTELIRALSGIDTDRLKEEKQRGISIELGFAHMILPSGREVGIVDVPGHERFVRQMLAGASGMDLVLLVIAADEGIKPQTREHLEILKLLEISNIIIVLNKIDLVDQDWKNFIATEIRGELEGTTLAGSPFSPVSALTKQGIPELLARIDDMLPIVEGMKTGGPVRMPLDRIFSLKGFGTVVTGTLGSGTVRTGQELAIEPGRVMVRVRSIQVHGKIVPAAFAGQRVAINLAGAEAAEISKGAVIVSPAAFQVGNILDLAVQNLPEAEKAIRQRQRLRFHIGTAEVIGRIHLLENTEILPGQSGYAQILLESPVLTAAGDRFVLRSYSPLQTVGGGKVLGIAAAKKKRFKEELLVQMRWQDRGDTLKLVEIELTAPQTLAELSQKFPFDKSLLSPLLAKLLASDRLEIWREDGADLYWAKGAAERWRSELLTLIEDYQREFPLRQGIGREELKEKMGLLWNHHRWQSILEFGNMQKYFKLAGGKVRANNSPGLPPEILEKLDCLKKYWDEAGFRPPDLEAGARKCAISAAEITAYAQYLGEQNEWVSVSGVYFAARIMADARNSLEQHLQEYGEISVAEVRELWQTSRRYAVPLLEYFDQQHLTRRRGDKRILYKKA